MAGALRARLLKPSHLQRARKCFGGAPFASLHGANQGRRPTETCVKATPDGVEVASLPRERVVPTEVVPLVASTKQTAAAFDSLLADVVTAPYLWYARSLVQYPLMTKACTALVGFMLGDLIAQHMTHPGHVDLTRTARLGAYGFLIDGPVGSWWYDQLEKYVYPSAPQETRAVLMKTFLDQTVYATIMTAVYFTTIKLLEGHPDAVVATLQAKFWPTLAANYCIWPLAHLINFRFVAPDFRILYNNVICIVWLTLVSLLTHTNISALFHLHV